MDKKFILPIAILVALAVMPSVLGVLNVLLPANATNHSGTISINVSYVNATDITAAIAANSTCYHNASGTWTAFTGTITVREMATTGSSIVMTPSISTLNSRGTSVNCSIGNNSGVRATNPGYKYMTFDNVAPGIQLNIREQSMSVGGNFHYDTAISDATSGVARQSCNITDPEKTIYTATIGTENLLFDSGRLIDKGTWTLSCSGGDYAGLNTTASDTITAKSINNPNLPTVEVTGIIDTLKKNKALLFLIIGVIAIIVIGSKKK